MISDLFAATEEFIREVLGGMVAYLSKIKW